MGADMTQQYFAVLLAERIAKTNTTLALKGGEYAPGNDRLHNFKVAARIDDQQPEQALWGMAKKHLVSIMDLIDLCGRNLTPSRALVNEKFGDMINYLILLEAMMIERIDKHEAMYE